MSIGAYGKQSGAKSKVADCNGFCPFPSVSSYFNFDEMKLENYLNNGKFYCLKGKFTIVKSRKPLPDSFAVIKDKNEITCVIEQSKIKDRKSIIRIENGWGIITFDIILPFGLVGFIAKISKALAEEGISIFVISAFSTDHILIKNHNLKKTINKLENLGFKISPIKIQL